MHYFQSTYICSKTMKKRHQLTNKRQVIFCWQEKGNSKDTGIDLFFKLCDGACYCQLLCLKIYKYPFVCIGYLIILRTLQKKGISHEDKMLQSKMLVLLHLIYNEILIKENISRRLTIPLSAAEQYCVTQKTNKNQKNR